MTLPKDGRPSSTAVKIVGDWYAPLGGVLMTVSASFALGAFPLDDVWHRLFGQDVTLWGPTHLLLIGGAGLATVGALILLSEGIAARARTTPRTKPRWLLLRQATLAGAFLVALSTFQAEYDFSVPQFRLIWHPILLMLAAGHRAGVGAAADRQGRRAARRGGLHRDPRRAVALGRPAHRPHHAALPPLHRRGARGRGGGAQGQRRTGRCRLGAIAGLGIGTIGLAAEWAWSHIWWTIPWTSALVPEGIIAGVLAGVAAGVIGGFVGGSLRAPDVVRKPEPRWLGARRGGGLRGALRVRPAGERRGQDHAPR